MKIASSYSTVCSQALLSLVVPLYKVERPLSVLFWQRGINDTYRVICADAVYSLRIYRHGLRSLQDIQYELAALNYLHEQGADVAYPVEKHAGGFITEITAPEGLRFLIVTADAKGVEPDYETTDNARLFGASLASLHQKADTFTTGYSRPQLDVDTLLHTSLLIIKPYLSRDGEQFTFFDRTVSDICASLCGVDFSQLDTGFCHGDCHGGNVHLSEGVLTHFDFDCCGFGLRVFEWATFRWDTWDADNGDELWSQFLAGYRAERDIGVADFQWVDLFVVIRHIWWMALIMGNAHDFGSQVTSDEFVTAQIRHLKKLISRCKHD